MSCAYIGNLHAFTEQPEGKGRHIAVFHTLEKRVFVFPGLQDTVCIVDSDFRSRIDAILAFPQFQQPCLPFIIEVYGKAVEDHVEAERRFIIKGTVAEIPLPYVETGGEDILCRQVGIAEGGNQFIQNTAFFFHAHTADFCDNLLPAPVVEEEEKEEYQKKDSEEQVHKKFLNQCFVISYEKLSKSVTFLWVVFTDAAKMCCVRGMFRECFLHPGRGYGAVVPAGRMRMDMPFPL